VKEVNNMRKQYDYLKNAGKLTPTKKSNIMKRLQDLEALKMSNSLPGARKESK
jgi:hypothetical protein